MNIMMMTIVTMVMVSSTPVTLAIMTMLVSVVVSLMLFKVSLSSWIAFVLILTFSSGMMTLFMYVTSLAPNETKKQNKTKTTMLVMALASILWPFTNLKDTKKTMKMFSNQALMMLMATALILTMVAISSHGHHPNQTLSSSF